MAFECNLAAGNKAVCQHHVIRQSVEHQQVLPELISTLQTTHENPRQNTPGTFNKPEGALKLQMPELCYSWTPYEKKPSFQRPRGHV